MRIEFHASGQALSRELREYATSTLKFAFERLERRVRRVSVHFWDANGPRGGTDKGVRLIVEFESGGEALVRDVADDSYVAITRASKRASYAARVAVERRRDRRRRPAGKTLKQRTAMLTAVP